LAMVLAWKELSTVTGHLIVTVAEANSRLDHVALIV